MVDRMEFHKAVVLAVAIFTCLVEGVYIEKRDASQVSTEDIITQEIARLAPIKEALEKANLNITVVFSSSKKDENDTLVHYDEVILRPSSSKYDPSGPQLPKELEMEQFSKIFELTKGLGVDAVISRESYLKDGSLSKKNVFADEITLHYKDESARMVLKDKNPDPEENVGEDFEASLTKLKNYEIPTEITKTIYNEKGETISTDTFSYVPKKVRIVNSKKMPIGMQLVAAEAVKRSFGIKLKSAAERMSLVCKFLQAKYSNYNWLAAVGESRHHVYSDVLVTLKQEGETYTIWGKKLETDKEE